jgi:hypothetical protein
MPIYEDANQLYDCFGALFKKLTDDPKVGSVIAKSGLIIRFNYSDPDCEITIDATREPIEIFFGACDLKPIVDMSMNADVAHTFWLGKLNLVSALTRGVIVTKGSIPAIMKLLPIISPAFKIYPEVLKEKGLEATIAP